MDPITQAIVSALSNVGGRAIGDAYDALKTALRRRAPQNGEVLQAIEQLEKNPDSDTDRLRLEQSVSSMGVCDEEILRLANYLSETVAPAMTTGVNVTQTISGTGNTTLGAGTLLVTHQRRD
jgi:hypothetical protein